MLDLPTCPISPPFITLKPPAVQYKIDKENITK